MALEAILSGIENELEAEREAILADARSKSDSIEKEAQKRAEDAISSARAGAKKRASEIKKRTETLADLDARKVILSAKMESVNRAFELAIESLRQMPDEEYQSLLVRVVSEAASGNESIVVSERDKKRLGARFLDELNEALREKNKPQGMHFADETREMIGGAILVSERLQVNLSLDALVERLRDELVPEVAAVLFSD